MAKVSTEIEGQLSAFHDPFSRLTRHPKIPDGTTAWSFGQTGSVVDEITNDSSYTEMHMIIFPGVNANFAVLNSQLPADWEIPDRKVYCPGFDRSGGVAVYNLANEPSTDVNATIGNKEEAAKWRLVSTGVQLKLLNTVEENDGWWEAIRLHEQADFKHMSLGTILDESSLLGASTGLVRPHLSLFNELKSFKNLQDIPSYSTGMLKDLHLVQFQLNGSLYKERWHSSHEYIILHKDTGFGTDHEIGLDGISDDLEQGKLSHLLETTIDSNYDMIYLRLHCRLNSTTVESSNGSRFLVNAVQNKELIYDRDSDQARYMTRCESIGSGGIEAHQQLRNLNRFAAVPINV